MIIWPAMIKYTEDDELIYISDLTEWTGDEDLHAYQYDPVDIFIDSSGLIHHLNHRDNDFTLPGSTGSTMELKSAIAMVKAHFSSMGSCCSAKLTARSIAELIELVGIEHNT